MCKVHVLVCDIKIAFPVQTAPWNGISLTDVANARMINTTALNLVVMMHFDMTLMPAAYTCIKFQLICS